MVRITEVYCLSDFSALNENDVSLQYGIFYEQVYGSVDFLTAVCGCPPCGIQYEGNEYRYKNGQ